MLANLKRAAFDRETVKVGGGEAAKDVANARAIAAREL